MSVIKLSVFSDYHYNPWVQPWALEGLDAIFARAVENNVDAVTHCGDFMVTTLEHGKPALDRFLHNPEGLPAFGAYGNHELQGVDSLEALNAVYGLNNSYYYRDLKGFRLIFLDTNHFIKDGVLQHYPGHSVGGPDWSYDHNLVGAPQRAWLRETLLASPYPCIIFSHSTFQVDGTTRDPDIGSCNSGSLDAQEIRAIFREVNEAHPNRVLLCINGHYHTNSFATVDGVAYFNVNAAYSGFWSLKKHDCFPKEFIEKYPHAAQCAYYNDPLNAIVTVSSDGELDIDGAKTTYMYGVTPYMCDPYPKPIFGSFEPRITSTHVKLGQAAVDEQ